MIPAHTASEATATTVSAGPGASRGPARNARQRRTKGADAAFSRPALGVIPKLAPLPSIFPVLPRCFTIYRAAISIVIAKTLPISGLQINKREQPKVEIGKPESFLI